MSAPLVSVIIPAYKAEKFIEETIQSVLNQTYDCWECLVVDDGSPDNTAAVIKLMAQKDNRIKYFYKPNGGLSSARNFGLSKASGDFIQFLDADDVLFPEKLSLMVSQYEALASKDIVLFSDFIYGQAENPYLAHKGEHKLFRDFSSGKEFDFRQIYLQWDRDITIPIHCFLFPASLIKGLRFNEQLKSKEDWDFHLALLARGGKFKPYDYVGCSYRVLDNSMSRNSTIMIRSSIMVLNSWNKSNLLYVYRLSHYFCQIFLLKLKKRQVDLPDIVKAINTAHQQFTTIVMTIVILLLPLALIQKIINFLRIRF